MSEISSAAGPSMNIPTASQKNVVIVGATGMVGGYALRSALQNPAIASVTTIGRRKLGISHPKLKDVVRRRRIARCGNRMQERTIFVRARR